MEELTESYEELLLKYNAALKTLETQIAILLQDFEFKNHSFAICSMEVPPLEIEFNYL